MDLACGYSVEPVTAQLTGPKPKMTTLAGNRLGPLTIAHVEPFNILLCELGKGGSTTANNGLPLVHA